MQATMIQPTGRCCFGLCAIETSDVFQKDGSEYIFWRFSVDDADEKWHKAKVSRSKTGLPYFFCALGRVPMGNVTPVSAQ